MISVYMVAAAWLGLVVLYKLTITLRDAYFTPPRAVPGPWYAPLTALRLKYAVITGTRTDYIHSLHQRYGSFVRISPSETSVADLPATKEIHRIGAGFTKAEMYRNMRTGAPDGPEGVFTMVAPKQHAARRKLLARGFSQISLRERWEPLVHERVKLAVSRMREETAREGKADVLKWWLFMATDWLPFWSLQPTHPYQKVDYIKAIENSMLGTAMLSELPLIHKICRLIPLTSFRNIFHANQILLSQGRLAMRTIKSTQHTSNIFDQIVAQSEKGDSLLTEEEVVSEAANLILAGTDTTANTATYMTWAILSHPSALASLRAELATVPSPYSDAKLEPLPVLSACIEETLRLYGAAPSSEPRTVPDGGAKLGPYFFPASTTVSTQAWTPHRHPEIFPEPEKFDVKRWLDGRATDAMRAAMAPFGHGSRVCLGVHLARMELRLAAAEFFGECEGARVHESTTGETMGVVNHFLIAPRGGRTTSRKPLHFPTANPSTCTLLNTSPTHVPQSPAGGSGFASYKTLSSHGGGVPSAISSNSPNDPFSIVQTSSFPRNSGTWPKVYAAACCLPFLLGGDEGDALVVGARGLAEVDAVDVVVGCFGHGGNLSMSSHAKESTTTASDKAGEQAFTDYYLRQATKEFGDDLAKLQKAPDFKNGSLEIIVEALKQGRTTISEKDRARIGRTVLEKSDKEE
ncbi:cytochrome P450 [Elsinoe ampelina]|uniref:Cytochrome P450 n=1 Tax=Elsinoe ampelina TaxID=302913 RepID=A0A6A6G3B0_9PEZI|nr:cytochrome P450 [Elsinoe ampelina]